MWGDESPPTEYEKGKVKAKKTKVAWGGWIKEREGMKGEKKKAKVEGKVCVGREERKP